MTNSWLLCFAFILVCPTPTQAQGTYTTDDAYSIVTTSVGGSCDPQAGSRWGIVDARCCGAPGRPRCVVTVCTNPPSNTLYDAVFGFGGTCRLPPAQPETNNLLPPFRDPAAGTDFRFMVTSDLHYYRYTYNVADQLHHVDQINRFGRAEATQGRYYRAVIVPGDETTGPEDERIQAYRMMWERGWLPGASIEYPVYFGYGNHESRDADSVDEARIFWNYLIQRMGNQHQDRNSTGCLIQASPSCLDEGTDGGSLNYSWDWQGVHMVQLNTWAGDTQNKYRPILGSDGLKWLENDLAQYVGDSGRPVIIFQHYGYDKFSNDVQYWVAADRANFEAKIAKYNVAALFTGHTHGLEVYAVPSKVNQTPANVGATLGTTLDNIVDGSGGDCKANGDNNTHIGSDPGNSTYCAHARSDFLSVHVNDRYLEITANSWKDTTPLYVNDDIKMTGLDGSLRGFCRKRLSSFYAPVRSSVATVKIDKVAKTFTVTNATNVPVPGALAIRVTSAALSQADFVDSCTSGSRFVLVTEGSLGTSPLIVPFQSVGDINDSDISLYRLNDDLVASPAVPVVGLDPVQVTVTTLSGAQVPFTFTVPQPADGGFQWLQATSNSLTTPATFTLSAVLQPSYQDMFQTLVIQPAGLVAPLSVKVSLVTPMLTVKSPSTGAQISYQSQSVNLPFSIAEAPGSQTYSLDVPSPQYPSPGTRYTFADWSDGQAQKHSVTVPFSGTSLQVDFKSQYQVTPTISGHGSVSISPSSSDGYYPEGSITLLATPDSGYYFVGYTGGFASTNPNSVANLPAPLSFTATFLQDLPVTFSTNIPAGEGAVLTVNGAAIAPPAMQQFQPGATITTAAPQTVNSATTTGVRYNFLHWQDGNAALTRVDSASASLPSLTAVFEKQVLVTVIPSSGGAVTGAGWFPVNSSVTLTAQAAAGNYFQGFTGGVTSSVSPFSFNSGGAPETIFAGFRPLIRTMIQANIQTQATIDGVLHDLPFALDSAPGLQHTLLAPLTVQLSDPAQRYVFTQWGDGVQTNSRTITIPASGSNIDAGYKSQSFVTVTANPADAGTATGAGWYDNKALAPLTATPLSGFQFTGFSGDYTSALNPSSISVVKPLKITANFIASGTPRIYAANNGPAVDSAGLRIVPILLTNAGPGGALNAQIDSISAIAVVSGTGVVSVGAPGVVPAGDLAVNASMPLNIAFTWPVTATRVRMTVNFSANNGAYHGATILTLFR